MKMNKKILIAAAVSSIIGAVITAAAMAILYDSSRDEMQTVTKTISTDLLKINISTNAGSIKIIPSDTDEITLTYSEDNTTHYNVTEDDYTLTVSPERIKQPKAAWYDYYFSFDFHSNDVVLSVPKGFSAKTELNSDFGNININGLKGSLKADCDYGNIIIADSDFSKIDINADCGNIKFTNLSGIDLNMECDLGDISGTIAGKWSDYSIDASSELGKRKITSFADTPRMADAPLRLYAHTNLGDIDIHFTE